MPNTEIVHMTF